MHDRCVKPGWAIAAVAASIALVAGCGTDSSSAPPSASPPPSPTSSPSPTEKLPPPGYSTISFDGPATINGKPAVYLTYDDGPETGGTDAVLKALAESNTKGTFFVLGSLMGTPAAQSLVKQEFDQGNSVSIHGWFHYDMSKWSRAQSRDALNKTKKAIEGVTGQAPTCFRPPYGSYGPNLSWEASHAGLRIQRWGGDTKDWAQPNAERIFATIKKNWKPGYVILMHDGAGHGEVAAKVTRMVIAEAAKRGYVIGDNLCPMTTDLNLTSSPPVPKAS